MRYFQQSVGLREGTDSAQSLAITVLNIAQIHYFQGRPDEAIARANDALSTCRMAGSRTGEAKALICLGTVYRSQGRLRLAVEYCREAVSLARNVESRPVECDALCALGDVFVNLGDLASADDLFSRALEMSSQDHAIRQTACAEEGLAHVLLRRGKVAEARRYWDQAAGRYAMGLAASEGARLHLAAQSTENGESIVSDEVVTCHRCHAVERGTAARSANCSITPAGGTRRQQALPPQRRPPARRAPTPPVRRS